ncbi:MAG: transposase, partial [Streptomycetaceae bacterium]|nr:transposase [Streptomycetaceae bacterium]
PSGVKGSGDRAPGGKQGKQYPNEPGQQPGERPAPGDLDARQWQLVRAVLPASDQRGAPQADNRRVVDGLRYRERTGVPWRNVPARYGSWQTLYGRHRRWTLDGTWARIAAVLDDATAAADTSPHTTIDTTRETTPDTTIDTGHPPTATVDP